MINQKFVKRKISLIQDELVLLEKMAHFTLEEVIADFMKQATIEHILERIINRAIDINQHIIKEMATKEISPPKDYTETFSALAILGVYPEKFAKSIAKSVGTRNKLTHDYDEVDHALIYSSMKDCLDDYRKYGEYILEFLEKNKK
jgi:uncharacterized protein YutE (UPF0331/DUF86 family)